MITDIETGKNHFSDDPLEEGSEFQWGRRYGAPSTNNQAIGGKMTIEDGEKLENASKIIGNSYVNTNRTWYYTWCSQMDITEYSKLWTPQNGQVKAQYDPCPDGWRLPTPEELTILYNKYSEKTKEGDKDVYVFKDGNEVLKIAPSWFFGWGIGTSQDKRLSLFASTCGINNSCEGPNRPFRMEKGVNGYVKYTEFSSTSANIRGVKIIQ